MERLGKTFDYTRKEGVEHSGILAPEGAPDWVHNREALWNAVEAVERRQDAQLLPVRSRSACGAGVEPARGEKRDRFKGLKLGFSRDVERNELATRSRPNKWVPEKLDAELDR